MPTRSLREIELADRLDSAANTIADAWAALGYRPADVPRLSLADAIRQRLSNGDESSGTPKRAFHEWGYLEEWEQH